MSLESILKSIGTWLASAWKSIQTNYAHIAVAVLQTLKNISDNGILDDIDKVFGNIVPPAILTAIKAALPKLIADLLEIEGLPANATPDQIKKFSDDIIASFAAADFDKKSQVYTTLGVQVIVLIQGLIASGETKSFAAWAILLENSYQKYLSDQADAQTDETIQNS